MKIVCQICKTEKEETEFEKSLNIDFVNDICRQCEKDLKDAVAQEEMDRHAKDMSVLEEATIDMCKEDVSALKEYIDETSTWNFKITDTPVIDRIENDVDEYPFNIHVKQTTNGGYSGDEYAGKISVSIPSGKYLTFDYAC